MKGVIVAAALLVALMVMIKDGRVLRKAGLTGSCTAIAAPTGQTGAWQRCKPGKLEGAPSLARDGCTAAATDGRDELWRCPARIQPGPGS